MITPVDNALLRWWWWRCALPALTTLPTLLHLRLQSVVLRLLIISQHGADLSLRRLVEVHHLRPLIGLRCRRVLTQRHHLSSRIVVDCLHLGNLIWRQVKFFCQEIDLMLLPLTCSAMAAVGWACLILGGR